MEKKEKKGLLFFLKNIGAVGTLRITLSVAIMLVIVVIIYARVSNTDKKEKDDEVVVSKVEEILSTNLESNYPATVRELVTYFTEIQECYYNEKINEEQLEQLATRARLLFDKELLEANPYETYYQDLKQEIKNFNAAKKTITRIIVDKSSDVDAVTMPDGVKAASIKVTYFCKEDNKTTKTVETYILRKDQDNRWKIYGWGIIDEDK